MTSENTPQLPLHVVIGPGFWLGGWAWDGVVPTLEAAGLIAHPVTLPGLEDAAADRRGITGANHVDAVARLVEALDGEVVLVSHSGGGPVVQQVADRDPARIRRIVYVDSGPLMDGGCLSPTLADDVVDQASEELSPRPETGSSEMSASRPGRS